MLLNYLNYNEKCIKMHFSLSSINIGQIFWNICLCVHGRISQSHLPVCLGPHREVRRPVVELDKLPSLLFLSLIKNKQSQGV